MHLPIQMRFYIQILTHCNATPKNVGGVIALVKDYFEKEIELESLLHPVPNIKDELDALKV